MSKAKTCWRVKNKDGYYLTLTQGRFVFSGRTGGMTFTYKAACDAVKQYGGIAEKGVTY